MIRGIFRSLAFRTGLMYLVMTLLLIVLFVLMIFENQLDFIIENSLLKSQEKSRQILGALDKIFTMNYDWIQDRKAVYENLILLEGLGEFRVYTEDGEVILDSKGLKENTWATDEEFRDINEVLTRQAFEGKTQVQKLKGENLKVYLSFSLTPNQLGVFQYDLSMVDIGRWLERLYQQVFVVTLLIVIINGGFALYFFVKIFHPLRIMVRATRTIQQGDLEVRVPIHQNDEIGELALAFNEMGAAIRKMHDEARGANPLSGLPGNLRIMQEIDDRLLAGDLFAVLYMDLDHFKAYNDKYGFAKGDEVILFVCQCLLESKMNFPNTNIFIGHEGGDDFVVVIDYAIWKNFADTFIQRFDQGIVQFYNQLDAKNGYIESLTRQGTPARFPLMSISIAVVSNRHRKYEHHAQLAQAAAEMKKLAKSKESSSYVEDIRGN